MEKEGHIVQLDRSDEDCLISPKVITRKKDEEKHLTLDSKLLNDQIFQKNYQMPNILELIDSIALHLSKK